MEKQGTHFWFMTIQTPNELGYNVTDYQGTITPARGKTRLDMYNQIRAEVWERYPRSHGGVTLSFDIQPNRI